MLLKSDVEKVYNIFRQDETLLRLLYYRPADRFDYNHDPLSEALPNITAMGMDEIYEIVDEHIIFSPLPPDFEVFNTEKLNRILFYPYSFGTSRYVNDATMQFRVFSHNDFMLNDTRPLRIIMRLNTLLNNKHVTGVGTFRFGNGRLTAAPDGYVGYEINSTYGNTMSSGEL